MVYFGCNNKHIAVIHKQKIRLASILASALLLLATLIGYGALAQAACPTPDPNQGTDTLSVTAPSAGTYYVWAQMEASTGGNSFYMQVGSGSCAIQVGGSSSIPTDSFTWVNYQNGNTGSLIPVTLSTAKTQIVLTGNGAGVGVGRLFFAPLAPSTGCSPISDASIAACSGTNTSPTVSMSAPANGSTVSGTTQTVSASATGNGGATIKSVQFQLNGQNLGGAVTTPSSGSTYQTSWDTTKVANGSGYNLTAIATDSNNAQATSGQTTVSVNNQTTQAKPGAPTGLKTTSVTSSQVALSWTAPTSSDPAASYKIYRNGSSIGTSKTTAYTDTSAPSGATYSYTVSAVDASSVEGPQSTALSVAVPAADTTPPTVTMTAPPAGNAVGKVTLTATATDNVQVKNVQFYLNYGKSNAATLGPVLTPASGTKTYNASYSWDTTTTANGSYTVTAAASDGTNPLTPATNPVSVAVNNPTTGGGGTITLSFNSSTKTLSWTPYTGASSYTVAQVRSSGTQYSWPHVSGTSCIPGGTCNVPAPNSNENLSYNVDPLDSNGNSLLHWATHAIAVTWPSSGTTNTKPPTPASLTATATSSSQIDLSWSEAASTSDPAKSFEIFRQAGSGSFTQVGTTTNTVDGDSTGLSPNTTYSYYVVAVDSANQSSGNSNTASATTLSSSSAGQYSGTLTGNVYDTSGKPIAGVTVSSGKETSTTAANGSYTLVNLDTSKQHGYVFSATGYRTKRYFVQLNPGERKVVNITLKRQ